MAIQTERRPEVETPPSLWEAAVEVVDAGQQVIVHRVDLLRNEVGHRIDQLREELSYDARQFAIAAGLVVTAGLVAMLGWVFLAVAFVAFLDRWLPLDLSIVVVGGLHFAVGGALVALAFQRFRVGAAQGETSNDAPSLPGDGRG